MGGEPGQMEMSDLTMMGRPCADHVWVLRTVVISRCAEGRTVQRPRREAHGKSDLGLSVSRRPPQTILRDGPSVSEFHRAPFARNTNPVVSASAFLQRAREFEPRNGCFFGQK